MPVENIHFVVHERIDSFLKNGEGDEVACSVDEQAAILEQRLVFDFDWQRNHIAVSVFFVAGDRLQKSFKRSHESDIMVCFYFSVLV